MAWPSRPCGKVRPRTNSIARRSRAKMERLCHVRIADGVRVRHELLGVRYSLGHRARHQLQFG